MAYTNSNYYNYSGAPSYSYVPNFHPGYANIQVEEPKGPAIDANESLYSVEPRKSAKWRDKPSFRSGWRFGAIGFATVAIVVLILNVGITRYAISKFGTGDQQVGTIYEGDCTKSRRLDSWLHIAINALSTALLAGSSFCMQCLSAPTRSDVDRAHKERRWLDIGIPSMRNLRYVGWKKVIVYVLLMCSSVPLHLLYNSAVFHAVTSYDYWSIDVPGNNLNYLTALINDTASFERLEKTACIDAYAVQVQSVWGNVIIVNPNDTTAAKPNETWVDQASYHTLAATNTGRQTFDWLCDEVNASNCSRTGLLDSIDQWPALYCLSEKKDQMCKVEFSAQIMTIVIICNAVKALSILLVIALLFKNSPLLTVGDGIASFLQTKDDATRNLCTFSKDDIKIAWKSSKKHRDYQIVEPAARVYRPLPRRWWRSSSKKRWFFTYLVPVLCYTGVLLLLAIGLGTISENGISITFSNLWSLGVGTLDTRMIVGVNYYNEGGIHGAPLPLPVVAIIANIPQTVLACCYFLLNALLTAMCLSKEYDSFATTRKELRVSMPTGYQRSNYFLQIPFKYGIPLNIVSFILHYFFSQSIFLARVIVIEQDGSINKFFSLTDCGYSPIAIILSIVIGLVLLAAIVCLGLRRYDGIVPIAGSCSAAISAACHRPDGDEKAAWHGVKWGETKYYGPRPMVCHLAFSSEDVFRPVAGNWYAGEEAKEHKD